MTEGPLASLGIHSVDKADALVGDSALREHLTRDVRPGHFASRIPPRKHATTRMHVSMRGMPPRAGGGGVCGRRQAGRGGARLGRQDLGHVQPNLLPKTLKYPTAFRCAQVEQAFVDGGEPAEAERDSAAKVWVMFNPTPSVKP